jgi:hypothetical protein
VEVGTKKHSQNSFDSFNNIQTYLITIINQKTLTNEQAAKFLDANTFITNDVDGISKVCPDFSKTKNLYNQALDKHRFNTELELFYEELKLK